MAAPGFARATVAKEIIFEALSLVKRAVHEGKIRKTRGAFFVGVIKRAFSWRRGSTPSSLPRRRESNLVDTSAILLASPRNS